MRQKIITFFILSMVVLGIGILAQGCATTNGGGTVYHNPYPSTRYDPGSGIYGAGLPF